MARYAFHVFVMLLLAAVVIAWVERKEIADDFIADALASRGVRASYTIESIAPGRQVIGDIVVGDPAAPDLTIERVEVEVTPRLGLPDITEITLVRPRLFGTLREGALSFGALDPLLFGGEEGPFEFPDTNLAIEDARALIATDFGRVGAKLAGAGHLRGGFAGEIALVAPALDLGGCTAREVTLYGAVGIDAERPELAGPLRFAGLDCESAGLALAAGSARLDLRADRSLAGFEGTLDLRTGAAELGTASVAGLAGEARYSWRDNALTAAYDLALRDLRSAALGFAGARVEGQVRGLENFARIEIESHVEGTGARLGPASNEALLAASEAGEGTLAAPLLARLRRNLPRELVGSALVADMTLRREGEAISLVLPEAALTGASGQRVLALSRGQMTMEGAGPPRLSGNLATGGRGLPRIAGRMERGSGGQLELRLRMEDYAAGSSRLALPEMRIRQRRDGGLLFAGEARASGALPGGLARALVVPLDGRLAPDGELVLWEGCRTLRFDSLVLAELALQRHALTLCPGAEGAILRSGPGGLRIAAGAPALDLRGRLGETPVAIASGPVGFAYPGTLALRDLAVTLGPPATATRFLVSDLTADFGKDAPRGTFDGADIFLAAVPLDIRDTSGRWSFAGGRLDIADGAFRLEDRQAADRFVPLVARNASLSLADNQITANAILRHPETDTAITRAQIAHDLASGTGRADLTVDGLTFRPGFEPVDLSRLALGVVAQVSGTVTGRGRIDWNAQGVTSSGAFSSESLDFAAAFGPVKGASGTIAFSDLLGLTTAPGQTLRVASVNPGIEIYDGEIAFHLLRGEVLELEGGRWPFLGGSLRLRPLTINIGLAESRTYVVEIEGLEAARFVERMELNNLSASGVFDGTIPIVFDEQGNGRLVGGVLASRPPGGHLSYVGQLTYEDLSYVGNLAFGALRDLQYRQAEIAMDGPLTGELVTRVRFEGIGQGETAERNILTRTLAKLPIRLLLNIRAPFYRLISTTRSLYDPSAVRDPRGLGLIRQDGARLRSAIDQDAVEAQDERAAEEAERRLREAIESPDGDETAADRDIQPPESEALP